MRYEAYFSGTEPGQILDENGQVIQDWIDVGFFVSGRTKEQAEATLASAFLEVEKRNVTISKVKLEAADTSSGKRVVVEDHSDEILETYLKEKRAILTPYLKGRLTRIENERLEAESIKEEI